MGVLIMAKKASKPEYAPIDIFRFKHGLKTRSAVCFDAVRVLSLNPRLQWFQLALIKEREIGGTNKWIACEFRTGMPFTPMIMGKKKDDVVVQALRRLAGLTKRNVLRRLMGNPKVNSEHIIQYTDKQRRKYAANNCIY